MEIKYSIQGLLIYAAMAGYLLALLLQLLRFRRTAYFVFTCGFILAVAAFAYRWFNAGHVPLQNLFELFIAMALTVYVLSLLSEKLLNVKQRAIDMLIGIVVLFPAGFIFSEVPRQLPPALQSVFFVPHVAVYVFGYIFMFKAAAAAVQTFTSKPQYMALHENNTFRLVRTGFPLLVLGLILGSFWAHYAWADYFGWDPKELWSLVTVLIYLGYFHWRFMFGQKHPRISSFWALAGFAAVIITLLWANLSNLFIGLHSYAV
ncbi:MAG: cytochrome c biogenesis protein CcsA [Phycisphaerae bacterium]|jgi:ABC-type transport system involved in cytochrome c biogenesis permease subunit